MNNTRKSGFTLVQISVLLTVASLVMVTVLPTSRSAGEGNRLTTERMTNLYKYFRSYMISNGRLPCPADGTLAQGSANYGVEAANGGAATNCAGSTPSANYVNGAQNVAVGMVPVRTMGLPNEYAYDGWGRAITYAVDTNVTTSCWSSPAAGAITVTNYGKAASAVMVLVSHGADGHGAFIPLAGASGTAVRFNNNSSDVNELLNAHVDASFAPTNTNLNNFVLAPASSTFDDLIVYSHPSFSMNALPAAASKATGATINSVSTTPGLYYSVNTVEGSYIGNTVTYSVVFNMPVTVTGTPRLAISAVSVGGGSVALTGNSGSGATGYANYLSGSGSATLTFTYPVQTADMAPNGMTIASPIDLNGGTIATTCGAPSFAPPSLANVIIPKIQAITASGTWIVPADWNSSVNFIDAIGSGGNGAQGITSAGGGAGGGGGGYARTVNLALTAGSAISVTVGAGGGAAATQFRDSSTLVADFGRTASGITRGNGGDVNSCVYTGTGLCGGGGAGGASSAPNHSTYGGGGGGGAPYGPAGAGFAGGNGGSKDGGGGGGGAPNGNSATAGANGVFTGGAGGNGGLGAGGAANNNGGAATGGLGGPAVANLGGGGGGGGGSTTTDGGAGGAGSLSLYTSVGVANYVGWVTNVAPIGNYGAGSGGGGSGAAYTGFNTGGGGYGGGFGAGGGGSGASPGTPGAAGLGSQGLIMMTWR